MMTTKLQYNNKQHKIIIVHHSEMRTRGCITEQNHYKYDRLILRKKYINQNANILLLISE